MRLVLLVMLNGLLATIVGFYVWTAVKLWAPKRGPAIASAVGALYWVVVWAIAGFAVVVEDVKRFALWFVLIVVVSTGLRIWATIHYRESTT